MIHSWTAALGYILSAAAAVYSIAALTAVRLRARPEPHSTGDCRPVTVLKPLCGTEPQTYACLRSFCEQDYPRYQVIFGVSDPHDPVIAVVHRLQREFPDRDLVLRVDRTVHGTSRKVSNLVNMMAVASNGYLVLSDSDVRVDGNYLTNVVAPLHDHSVGIVTCAYRGLGTDNLWSLLGAMYINEWFVPSVRVAAMSAPHGNPYRAPRALWSGADRGEGRTDICTLGVELYEPARAVGRGLVSNSRRRQRATNTERLSPPRGYSKRFEYATIQPSLVGSTETDPEPA
jgi:ceramide glucosyltransferase